MCVLGLQIAADLIDDLWEDGARRNERQRCDSPVTCLDEARKRLQSTVQIKMLGALNQTDLAVYIDRLEDPRKQRVGVGRHKLIRVETGLLTQFDPDRAQAASYTAVSDTHQISQTCHVQNPG